MVTIKKVIVVVNAHKKCTTTTKTNLFDFFIVPRFLRTINYFGFCKKGGMVNMERRGSEYGARRNANISVSAENHAELSAYLKERGKSFSGWVDDAIHAWLVLNQETLLQSENRIKLLRCTCGVTRKASVWAARGWKCTKCSANWKEQANQMEVIMLDREGVAVD